MTQQTEWEKTYDRIKANAQKVDIIAEREAFEKWQTHCGLLPIDTRHHDPETGYRDTITGRNLDRWDAWLARAVRGGNDYTPRAPQYGKLGESLTAMCEAAKKAECGTMHYHDLFRIEGYLHSGVCIQKTNEYYILSISIAFAESPEGDYFWGKIIHKPDELNLKNVAEIAKELVKGLAQYEEDIEEIETANNLLLLHIRKSLNPSPTFNVPADHKQDGE